MQNTTFRCGHCGNLMAVSSQFLGQQVACPTCKQVVVAPSQTAPEPEPQPQLQPQPFPSLSVDSEHESIFSTPTSDDLFDEPAPVLAPTVEYRPEPTPEPAPVPAPETLDEEPPTVLGANDLAPTPGDVTPVSARVNWPTQPRAAEITDEPAAHPAEPATRKKGRGDGSNWLIVFMIPLVSYAVLATALIFYLWNRMEAIRNANSNPIQFMPDINGDYPGGKKVSANGKALTWRATDALAVADLPRDRKVKLGETLTVGNLEVTPTRIERKKVSVFVLGFADAAECLHESLVLHLKLKNVSTEYQFVPLEDSFDRFYKNKIPNGYPPLDAKPLTNLQVGSTTFFGGPANWLPRVVPKSLERQRREWVEGRPGPREVKPLKPGETQETFTCTDGQNEKIVPAALSHKGDLFWRVHLRQGPVHVKDRDQPVPSTTIVGVSFTAKDVQH